MKNLIIGILLIATVVFGGLYFVRTHKVAQEQASLEASQQDVSNLQATLAEQEQKTARLREELDQARADALSRSQAVAQLESALQQTPTNQTSAASAKATASANGKSSNPFADMFKNPGMKDMIKNQQKAVLGPMIDKNYAKLFADLNLTPDQASAFKDILLNKQMSAAEAGLSMFSGDSDPTNRADVVQQVKTASDAADAQIKQLLGDSGFTQYQTYEKTMSERTAVSGFKDQLGAGPMALTDVQEQQLIQALTQERENFKFTTDFSDKSRFTGDFASMFTEEKISTYLEELGQLNQQYQNRAQTILSPDQMTAFGKYLSSQTAMQKAGMQMAVKMFAPAKSGD
jgi:hypothetical protein